MMTDQKCVWIDLCSRLRGSNKNLEGAFGMHNLISPTFLLLQKIPQQAAKKEKYLTVLCNSYGYKLSSKVF